MVGVPRSKGCRICVQRRVKCDQTRPTCNNCKKGNRPCPGYGQDLRFQDEGARLRQRFKRKEGESAATADAGHDSSESPPDNVSTETATPRTEGTSALMETGPGPRPIGQDPKYWDIVGLDMNITGRRTFLGLLEGKSEVYAQLAETMPEVSQFKFPINMTDPRLADRADGFQFSSFGTMSDLLHSPEQNQNVLITKFKESLFPDNGTLPPPLKYHTRWLAHLPPLTGTNPLLDAAVRAVTLVHIGRLNNSEPFVMESRPYYGQALRLLNKALQSKSTGMSNETLCAVILLSFYEMFASDNNDSWVRHAGGVSALMRARGPARHRHGFDREIFLAYRYTLIIEAFEEDVPCFLAEPGWIQLSHDIHTDLVAAGVPAARLEIFNLAEEYYSTMVKLPELCAHARAFWQAKQSGTPPPYNRAELLEKMVAARVAFKTHFSKFEAALKKAGHAPTIKLNQRDPLIGIEYEFINTFVSATYTGFWTVLVVLNLCLQGLQSDDADMVQLYQMESQECSLNICRSAASMLNSSFLGPFFLIFGLRVGLLVFEETSADEPCREADWILRKLFEIGDRHMGMAKHVPGYKAGISVNELIAEFRARKARSKESTNVADQMEFNRQVADGDILPPNNYGPEMEGPRDHMNGTQLLGQRTRERPTTLPSHQKGTQQREWQGLTQVEDVLNVWDEQESFQLHTSTNPLNLRSHGNRSRSGTRSPRPPAENQGMQFSQAAAAFAMPDMSFFQPDLELDDMHMPKPGQDNFFQVGELVASNQVSIDVYQPPGQPTTQEMQEATDNLSQNRYGIGIYSSSRPQQSLPRGAEPFFSE